MGATMLPLLALLLWAAATPTQANDDCPQEKTVGGVCFTKVADDVDTSEYNCTGSCTYQDGHGDKYCFKAGPYKVEDTCPAPTTPGSETETDTEGQYCNRDCTEDITIKRCSFTFTLEQLYSDTEGRLADGKVRPILVYNGQLPGPTIAVCEGDTVVMTLENRLNGDNEILLGSHAFNSTTLHFHGIREKQPVSPPSTFHPGWTKYGPWSDGVPRVTQCPTPAGEDFSYIFHGNGPGGINAVFNNAPAGTYWYHSHVGNQRMNGAEGKLIIMPRAKSDRVDVDLPENSLFLQEWYASTDTDPPPTNLLVNGKGKQSPTHCKIPTDVDVKNWVAKFKMGKEAGCHTVPNDDYGTAPQANYEVFNISEKGKRYRFRIIGGIGDIPPIRLSVEDHTFTVIAADSIDVESVSGLEALWVANGERYDIVIDTKSNPNDSPYKIYLYSHYNRNGTTFEICSLAWLKYPGQTVDNTIEAKCPFIGSLQFTKVLNPVPTNFSDWGNPDYIYPINLTAVAQADTIDTTLFGLESTVLNTQYLSLVNMTFNNYSMAYPNDYPEVPFLFQSPTNHLGRCGVNCELDLELKTECTRLKPDGCGTQQPPIQTNITKCHCPHVIQQPWIDLDILDIKGVKYWFEIVLINIESETIAHPIHMHGGWYNIVGMGQFNKTTTPIYRDTIMDMDKQNPLPRNFDHPVFKDVIQVPTNGYVIFRVPLDNKGTWIVHCHINYHIEHGMAMIFQIGKPDGPFRWSMGPDKTTAQNNMNKPCP